MKPQELYTHLRQNPQATATALRLTSGQESLEARAMRLELEQFRARCVALGAARKQEGRK